MIFSLLKFLNEKLIVKKKFFNIIKVIKKRKIIVYVVISSKIKLKKNGISWKFYQKIVKKFELIFCKKKFNEKVKSIQFVYKYLQIWTCIFIENHKIIKKIIFLKIHLKFNKNFFIKKYICSIFKN